MADIARAVASMPRKIKVGPLTYAILVQDDWLIVDGKTHWGQCDVDRNQIVIAATKHVTDVNMLVGVVLHELLHAIWAYRRINDSKLLEERVVAHLELGLTGLLAANPDLLKWLGKVENHE